MAEKLKIIPLGGLDEIGKNITVLEYGRDMIIVDCGVGFPDEDMYGVDLVIPDFTYLVQNAKKLLETTDASVGLQGGEWYHYITVDAFRKMVESGEIFESTTYAGHSYGSCKSDVEKILESGKHVLTVMDICGAMSLKTHFPKVTTVYVQRDRRQLLTDLLEKPLSTEEKVNRLMALDSEMKNADICDYTVSMDDPKTAAREIVKALF